MPSLPIAPPSLASAYIHPDKEHIRLFSRYRKINVTYIAIAIHGYVAMV